MIFVVNVSFLVMIQIVSPNVRMSIFAMIGIIVRWIMFVKIISVLIIIIGWRLIPHKWWFVFILTLINLGITRIPHIRFICFSPTNVCLLWKPLLYFHILVPKTCFCVSWCKCTPINRHWFVYHLVSRDRFSPEAIIRLSTGITIANRCFFLDNRIFGI